MPATTTAPHIDYAIMHHALRCPVPSPFTPLVAMPGAECARVCEVLDAAGYGARAAEWECSVTATEGTHSQWRSRDGRLSSADLARRLYARRYLLPTPRVCVLRATDAVTEAMAAELNGVCLCPELQPLGSWDHLVAFPEDCPDCHGTKRVGPGLLLPTGQRVVIEPAPMLALATVECHGTGRVSLLSLCVEAEQ